jgi:hypothetical protein
MNSIRITPKKPIIFFIGILSSFPAFTQFSDSLRQKFEHFSSQHLQEKVFVHTDKSFYLVGEIIWFKVYVTDAVFNKPSGISKISYVEIINKDAKAILQAKIGMNSGSGNGSFMLPSFLATGNYTIRAYTNWMKNIGPEYYFEKNISIVNALKNARLPINDSTRLNVQFFPEGGQMVMGLQSTVAFHFTDESGSGINGNGYLLNQDNDTILQFSPHHGGIGRFSFTPEKNNQYKALIRFEKGKIVAKQLPAAYEKGYVTKVGEHDTTHIKVVLTSNISADNTAYLFIHTRNRYKAIVQQSFNNGEAVFVIDKKVLDDGINHFTVFNNDRLPVCERLYFKRPLKKLDIDLTVGQTTFSQRTKVDITLFTHHEKAIIPDGGLSLSAFLLDSLQGIDEPGILSYLLLTSDLAERVESPDWYINNNNAEGNVAIDNLMLTHGWRRFKWEEILQNKKKYFEDLPEMEGTVVIGKVFDKMTRLSANNITAYLSVPGHNFRFTSAVSNGKGELIFNVRKFYGSNEFIAQTNNIEDSNYRVDIMSPFSDKFSIHAFPPLTLNEKWKDQMRARSIYAQADNVYLKERKQKFNFSADTDTSHFYGKPDKTYNLDDYTRFTTMEEVMREFVTEVRVRKPSANYDFKVRRPNSLSYFDSDPLVLLDGVPVFNVNKIMEMDPLKIRKMDIVRHNFFQALILLMVLSVTVLIMETWEAINWIQMDRSWSTRDCKEKESFIHLHIIQLKN